MGIEFNDFLCKEARFWNNLLMLVFCREYTFTIDGKEFKLTKDMVSIHSGTETKHVEEIVPNVIEPSFGIGRIMYSLFEHNFRIREKEESRTVGASVY